MCSTKLVEQTQLRFHQDRYQDQSRTSVSVTKPYYYIFSPVSLILLSTLFLHGCGLSHIQKLAPFSSAQNTVLPDEQALPHYVELPEECFITLEALNDIPAIPGPDLWDRIRNGFALTLEDNKRVKQQLNWYKRHPSYMNRVAQRGERYLFYIVDQIEARNIPLEIALLPIVESAFDPFAYSHGRASGMWQIIPNTGKGLGLKQNWWYDGRRDVVASTDAALNYLEQLNKRFDGDWLLALAAYNSGGGNVSKAIRKNKKRGKPVDFWHLDLPKETKAYVPKLIALAKLIKNPEQYGLDLYSIANKPYFQVVNTESQIDLAQAAELADIDMAVLYHLNPGFNRWATDPKGPHQLLIPIGKAEGFEQKLSAIPLQERITWDRYTIKSGDSISTIAAKHKISVASLKSINGLKSSRIRAGKTLMVPIAKKNETFYAYTQNQRLIKRQNSSSKRQKGQKINYTVKPGDSFWSIGKQFRVASVKIARWNNMGLRDPIKPGQKLVIWTSKTAKAAAPSNTTLDNSGQKIIRKVSYKVRNGDSLHRIADKFQLTVNDILQWNSIDQSKYLQPGQSLTLFVDVTKGVGS